MYEDEMTAPEGGDLVTNGAVEKGVDPARLVREACREAIDKCTALRWTWRLAGDRNEGETEKHRYIQVEVG